jgi:ASC-1-like (ASCH) protein
MESKYRHLESAFREYVELLKQRRLKIEIPVGLSPRLRPAAAGANKASAETIGVEVTHVRRYRRDRKYRTGGS